MHVFITRFRQSVGAVLVIPFLVVPFGAAAQQKSATASGQDSDPVYANIEFAMPKVAEPAIPNRSVRITDFGAVGDGQQLNTKAFAAAIEAITKQGGGRVVIPPGIWLTGPIILKSNINLHSEAGALVVFSKNFNEYPLVNTSFEGLDTYRCISPVYGVGLENIAITGEGVFDGSGDTWRPVKKSKLTETQWKNLVASGGVLTPDKNTWYPTEKALKGAQNSNMNVPANLKTREDYEQVKDYLRPVMVSLVNCKKVLLDGPTFQNSPAWCLHPLMCEDITLRNLTVKNPWYSQNGDGLDLESCKNAVVYKCSFDVGDDAICFKSGKDADGRRRGKPTENAIVKDCIVYHGHGGFTVGSEMSGGVRNVHVSNCTFIGTDVGLRFKSTRGRGGIVEKVFISNITMVNIPAESILFDLYYSGGSPVPEPDEKVVDKAQLAASLPPVTEATPQFRDISIKNVTCKGAGQAVFLQGLPEMNLKNIRLENVTIDATKGLECIDSDGIQITNVRINADKGPAMHFKNGRNVQIEGFRYQIPGKTAVKVEGALSENIRMNKADFGAANETIVLESNVKREALKLN